MAGNQISLYPAIVNISNPKVLILGLNYAPEPTGNAPYTTSLAEGLAQRGFAVRVIAAHPHYPRWSVSPGYGGWKREDRQNGVLLTRLSHYVPSNPSSIRRIVSELSFGARLWFSRWGKPDVVIGVSPALISSAMAGMKLRVTRRRTPYVLWVQDLYSLGVTETGAGGSKAASVMTALESRTLGRAARVVAIHDRFKRYMTGVLGVPADDVEVIRNWTHLSEAPETDRNAWRKRFGWKDDEVIVLHAGNQGAKQGLENVVEAARYAEEAGLPVRFVLLGDGNQRRRLEELGSAVSRLQFIDPLPGEEFQHAMAASDFLLVNELPGVAEMAVPSKLTSYFSTGLPVIAATDEGSITAEEVANAGGGVRVNAGDPQALAEIACSLREDPDRANRMGAAGRRYREEVLGQDAAIQKFEELLTALVNR